MIKKFKNIGKLDTLKRNKIEKKLNTFKSVQTTLLLLAAVTTTNVIAKEGSSTARIVNGTVAPQGQYPFVVSFSIDDVGAEPGEFHCGGTLIDSRWVLTAGHCLDDIVEGVHEVNVVIGRHDHTSDDGVVIRASRVIIHEDYVDFTSGADIGLIELSRPVLSDVIALPSKVSSIPRVGESGIVAGWGATAFEGEVSDVLQEVSLPVVSDIDCLPYFPATLSADGKFCAGGAIEDPRDSCNGDSGGPLFVERNGVYVQAGIVSGGLACALPGVPANYTQLTTFVDWVARLVPNVNIVTSEPIVPVSGFILENDPNTEFFPILNSESSVSERTGSLRNRERAMYEVTGSVGVRLVNLNDGDTDLRIVAGFDGNPERTVLCSSLAIGNVDELCEYEATDRRLFAIVEGYFSSETNYEIIVMSQGQSSGEMQSTGEMQSGGEMQNDDAIQRLRTGGGMFGILSLIGLFGGLLTRRIARGRK